ncbi:MAG: hypothetical protein KAW93_07670 [Methanogenium sp.]|nr:hypothetical protein [Methanogenium sp.]
MNIRMDLGRQEKTALALLTAVLIILIFAHCALTVTGKGAFTLPYSDSSKAGDLVSLEGCVEDLRITSSGDHMILSVDGVHIFIPSGAVPGTNLKKGEEVSIIGTVSIYKGENEIVVSSPSDIRVIT